MIDELIQKKEYTSLRYVEPTRSDDISGYIVPDISKLRVGTLQLNGHQIFIKNLFNPRTPYKRIVLNHQTGSGKTMVLNATAKMYMEYFKQMRESPVITVISFQPDIIVNDLLKFPELGYISKQEIQRLDQLHKSPNENDKIKYANMSAAIRRRITNKSSGGFYRFYGYQKFSNDVFIITPAGISAGIKHKIIYDRDDFIEYIEKAINGKLISVNNTLINSMKYGLVFCDEIHNVYNMKETNNRGLAIKYVLDLLEREDPTSSPRVIYASATLFSGSPTEVISLMNLVIPLADFKKDDFFNKEELKPGALEKISELCKGYISFVNNNKSGSYPARIIAGEPFDDIKYLNFIKCPLSRLQQLTMDQVHLPTQSFILNDMVFPNPKFKAEDIIAQKVFPMLYDTNTYRSAIAGADTKWKKEIGIDVMPQTNTLTGSFLDIENIGIYSSKYKQLLTDVLKVIKTGTIGKMLVYHPYITGAGVLLLKEMFIRNGFVEGTNAILASTICSMCGVRNDKHSSSSHKFIACRLMTMYGDDRKARRATLSLFKAASNVEGYEYRMIIGSKVIQEGVDFNAVRFLYVASPTTDISALMQVFGRAVRHASHDQLEQQYRTVEIRIYVQVPAANATNKNTQDLMHYREKMKTYVSIQKIEAELHKHAIDCFINYDKMKKLTSESIDGVPYEPSRKISKSTPSTFSWKAFGHNDDEIFVIMNIIKKLFILRPVWKYDDLKYNIYNPEKIYQSAYDHSSFEENSIIIALNFLISDVYAEFSNNDILTTNPYIPYIQIYGELKRIVYAEPYFILTMVDEMMAPILDYDSFLPHLQTPPHVVIDLTESETIGISALNKLLARLEMKYKDKNILNVLIDYDAKFHSSLLRAILEKSVEGQFVDAMSVLYDEINYYVYTKDFIHPDIFIAYNIRPNTVAPIGYVQDKNVFIWNGSVWTELAAHLLKRSQYNENDIIIGFIDYVKDKLSFRVRPPLHKMKDIKDMRNINRGTRCETLTQNAKSVLAKQLKVPETGDICSHILNNLLKREYEERKSRGVVKWLYTPMEFVPIKLNN